MAGYYGGQSVKGGYYWSGFKGELLAIDGETGILPGSSGTRYRKVPLPLLPPLGLFLGGAYVLFLPFAGFAMVLGYAGFQAWQGLVWVGCNVLQLAAPAWTPGEAFFARRPRTKEEAEQPAEGMEESPGRLKELEEEIAKRREKDSS